MNHEAGDERVRKVMDLIPSDWDKGPMVLSTEIRNFLKSIVDEGTSIDSGGGDGIADLHPIVGGVEYHVQIRTSCKVDATRLDIPKIEQLKTRIDIRLNNCLCEMKPGFDDSITGFNQAWDIVRQAFAELEK